MSDLIELYKFCRGKCHEQISSEEDLIDAKGMRHMPESNSDIGYLLIHGFSASPLSMRTIFKEIQAQGYAVIAPCLAGHATTPDDLMTVNWQDWYQSVEAAYFDMAKSCQSVRVIGLSLGGALALQLAAKQKVERLHLLAPAVYPPFSLKCSPIIAAVLKCFSIKQLTCHSGDILNPDGYEYTYRKMPANGYLQLLGCMKDTQKRLSKINTPVDIYFGRQDHVLPISGAEKLLQALGTKDKHLHWLEDSAHVITAELRLNALLKSILLSRG